jgi:hypothetical protein
MTELSRADHLVEVADLLWPAPLHWELCRPARRRGAAVFQEFVVVPSARSPRMLVPTRPKLAAAALRNSQPGWRRRERLRALALATAFRLGVGAVVFRDRLRVWAPAGTDLSAGDVTLKSHLDALVESDGSWALPITRPRANRKPVLQVLSRSGRPVAFVKLATNELTRDLVRAEGESLERVRGLLPTTRIPEVIDRSDWRGLAMLLLAPLPLGRRSSAAPVEQQTRAAAEIARSCGTSFGSLRESAYWQGLRDRLTRVHDDRSAALLQTWHVLDDRLGSLELQFGAWHGDWAPWNMAWVDDELLVWDFERFEHGVPLGLDFVHTDLQTRILDPARRASSVILDRLAHAPEILEPIGVPTSKSFVVFTLYLLEIAWRWLNDGQEEAGGWQGVVDDIVVCAQSAAARACAENPTVGSR